MKGLDSCGQETHPRRRSTLDLDPLPKSMLGRNELLELRRRRCL